MNDNYTNNEDEQYEDDGTITFSEQIVYAMFKPSKYKDMVNLKTSRFVVFTIVLSLVLGIVSFAVPTSSVIAGFGGFTKLFQKNVGTFTFSDGVLNAEKKFEMTVGLYHIMIDTEQETVSTDDMTKEGMYIAFGSKTLRMTMVANGQVMDYDVSPLSNILIEGFNTEQLVQMIPFIYTYIVTAFFVIACSFFLKYGLYALILGIYINAINKNNNLGLTFGKVFMLCFYGQTLGIILSNFNAALGLLPELIVNIISIFISFNMITTAVVSIDRSKQV